MPMMLLIFVVMVTVFAIGTELKHATAREWLGTANGSVGAALTGKILPVTVIMFLMSLVMFLVIFKVVGVPLNGSLDGHPREYAALYFELPGHRGIHRIAALEPAPVALDRRRVLGVGLHLLGPHVPDHGHVARHAVPEQGCSRSLTTPTFSSTRCCGAPRSLCSLPDMGYMSLFIVLPLLCLPRLRTICTEEKYWGRL